MERFLYRLSQSRYKEKFILKGALMLTAWHAPASRPTKDIDLLALVSNRLDTILPIVREVCNQNVEPDGVEFDADSVKGAVIKEDADYEGVHVTFQAYLQNARVQMQIDMGFGDAVTQKPTSAEYPVILDFPRPKLRAYNRETAVAEKFEAIVKLGLLNSRMRDFYDIWLLSRQFDFDGAALAASIARTFATRNTAISLQPTGLANTFAEDPTKIAQWRGFLRKSRLDSAPQSLNEVVQALAAFLLPVAVAIGEGRGFTSLWKAPGPWAAPADRL